MAANLKVNDMVLASRLGLIRALERHRAAHEKIYRTALAVAASGMLVDHIAECYATASRELERRKEIAINTAKRLVDGKTERVLGHEELAFDIHIPEHFLDDYDELLAQFRGDVRDAIEVHRDDFHRIFDNRWWWSQRFNSAVDFYKSSPLWDQLWDA